jgi:hypothetical protein
MIESAETLLRLIPSMSVDDYLEQVQTQQETSRLVTA